jgi:hypothetical protein
MGTGTARSSGGQPPLWAGPWGSVCRSLAGVWILPESTLWTIVEKDSGKSEMPESCRVLAGVWLVRKLGASGVPKAL